MNPHAFSDYSAPAPAGQWNELIETTPFHIAELLPNIRQADRDAWLAEAGLTPEEFLPILLRSAGESWTVMVDARVVCIFSVLQHAEDRSIGFPYFVCSREAEHHAGEMLERFKSVLNVMQQYYSCLMNYVDVRNRKTIRFLRRIGFTVHPAQPYGAKGMLFRKFTLGGVHV